MFNVNQVDSSKRAYDLLIDEDPGSIEMNAWRTKQSSYDMVSLRHKDLVLIVNNDEPSWRQAVSNVKGIYAITDLSNGSLYIGSAYGAKRIWQRWSSYAKGFTGGNKEFEDIKRSSTLDEEYIKKN